MGKDTYFVRFSHLVLCELVLGHMLALELAFISMLLLLCATEPALTLTVLLCTTEAALTLTVALLSSEVALSFTVFLCTTEAALALPVLSLPVLSLPVLTLPVLSLPVLSLPVLSLPVLSLPVLSLTVLSLTVLSLPVTLLSSEVSLSFTVLLCTTETALTFGLLFLCALEPLFLSLFLEVLEHPNVASGCLGGNIGSGWSGTRGRSTSGRSTRGRSSCASGIRASTYGRWSAGGSGTVRTGGSGHRGFLACLGLVMFFGLLVFLPFRTLGTLFMFLVAMLLVLTGNLHSSLSSWTGRLLCTWRRRRLHI
jgi:hypothetical protein